MATYEQILRETVLYSAAIVPDLVAQYLHRLTRRHNWRGQEEVLRHYPPVVDHLPEAFVDFALDALIAKAPEDPYEDHGFLDDRRLGLVDHPEYFPPSHIQGPFLRLLRRDEMQGLRLIHALVNTAVAKWREREQRSRYGEPGRTPLPVTVHLSCGPRQFWGDPQVYYWYRPLNTAPPAATSALMALEVWVEEQIEAGRDAEELFTKLLCGSECVAVLGLCLGVALAYHEQCLGAALPIVATPAVWRMDVARVASDTSGVSDFDLLGLHRHITEINAERNRRPQRSLDVRSLAALYALSPDDTVRVPFEQAVARFTEDLPFFFEETGQDSAAVEDLREQMEHYQAFCQRNNYRFTAVEGAVQVTVELPAHIQAQAEAALAPVHQRMRWFRCTMWAHKSLDIKRIDDSLCLDEAVGIARDAQQLDGSTGHARRNDSSDNWRLQAIAGVAAAIVAADFAGAQQKGLVRWAREILLAAARAPVSGEPLDRESRRDAEFPLDPKVFAARGLGALVACGAADEEVRQQLLLLAADPQLQVMRATVQGLSGAWRSDEVLWWNAVSLALSLSLLPERLVPRRAADELQRARAEAQWVARLVRKHLRQMARGVSPELLRVSVDEDTLFLWDVAERALAPLPLAELAAVPSAKAHLLRLADDLMTWTVAENTPSPEDRYGDRLHVPYEWNTFFFGWVVRLARSLEREEVRQHILDPVRQRWPSVPRLTEELLEGYITQQIGSIERPPDDSIACWKEICAWVLDTPDLCTWARHRYFPSDVDDVLKRIVFGGSGGSLLTAVWPHVLVFTDVIGRWVHRASYQPDVYPYLIHLLDGPGWRCVPEPALGWLTHVVQVSPNMEDLWRRNDNGTRTARLLQRIWDTHHDALGEDSDSLRRLSTLVDHLVAAGEPMASMLQRKLEQLE